jgi:hypothetical protein
MGRQAKIEFLDINKFWSKVDKRSTNECWNWAAGKYGNGYGKIKINGFSCLAHRVSYELFNGEIIDNLNVLHKCDNKLCVNPNHLYLGTQSQNNIDMYNRNRQDNSWHKSRFKDGEIWLMSKLFNAGISQYKISKMFKCIPATAWRLANIERR